MWGNVYFLWTYASLPLSHSFKQNLFFALNITLYVEDKLQWRRHFQKRIYITWCYNLREKFENNVECMRFQFFAFNQMNFGKPINDDFIFLWHRIFVLHNLYEPTQEVAHNNFRIFSHLILNTFFFCLNRKQILIFFPDTEYNTIRKSDEWMNIKKANKQWRTW